MQKITTTLTVFFEPPYWIGVIEKIENDKLSVNKVTFESEPKDYLLYDFYNKNQYSLKFSRPMNIEKRAIKKKINPKRMHREINKSLKSRGVSTKSQEAMRLERERDKSQKKYDRSKENREESQKKYLMKKEKKKQKKKGR